MIPDDQRESRDSEALHPGLEAALARDGVPVVHLARLLDLDVRTVRRWGDGNAALADFVAGRARAVKVVGGPLGEEPRTSWALERFGAWGVSPVEVAEAADRAASTAEALAGLAVGLRQLAGDGSKSPVKSTKTALTVGEAGYTVAPMNQDLLHDVASRVRQRAKGRMVMFAQKVPPDFGPRLAAAARQKNMSPSDFLRALVELHTEPLSM